MAVLKEARNVKYGSFVAPGNFLRVEVDFLKDTEAGASFKAAGSVNDSQALSARIEMAYFNLGDKQPELAGLDQRMIEHNKARWSVLQQGSKHAHVA
jgi:3-hydroxyacyl-[acyl-carrier-protein] dehydratase